MIRTRKHRKKEENIKKPLWMREYREKDIPLWLNNYDDIFSDFDPRHYRERALSADFLDEVKRASRDKESVAKLSMLVPKKGRYQPAEDIIKKRLKGHFQKHFNLLKEERWGIIKRGVLFLFFGIILMFVAAYILYKYQEASLMMSFLIIILEPGGWFLFWEGLYQVIFDSKVRTPDYTFYQKMAGCRIEWKEYDK